MGTSKSKHVFGWIIAGNRLGICEFPTLEDAERHNDKIREMTGCKIGRTIHTNTSERN